MNIIVPNYYKNFKCIADKCKNNCCIGWEIGIDNDTLDYYNSLKGEFGDRVKSNIKNNCFVLKDKDRCPFLNGDGLCDIIINLGEKALCEICTYHPRFRNFYSDFCEMGIGLCCEEAVRVILNQTKPFSLELLEGENTFYAEEDEEFILTFRQKLFKTVQDRSIPFKVRLESLFKQYNFNDEGLLDKFLSLERLDECWTDMLNNVTFDMSVFDDLEIPFEQLLCYFIYRHLADAIWENNLVKRVRFCLAAVYLCGGILNTKGEITTEALAEIARRFSAEVEYSEENMESIIKSL